MSDLNFLLMIFSNKKSICQLIKAGKFLYSHFRSNLKRINEDNMFKLIIAEIFTTDIHPIHATSRTTDNFKII